MVKQKQESELRDRVSVIRFEKDIMTIQGCVAAAQEIDRHLNRESPSIALVFADEIIIIGSFLGLLVKQILRIQELSGRVSIITKNKMAQELLRITNVNALISVYPTWEEFARAEEI